MDESIRIPFHIPFYTQRATEKNYIEMGFSDAEDAIHWSSRGCGIAALRMVVDGIRAEEGLKCCPLQGEMVHRGVACGAYLPTVGWIHQGLVDLAGEMGVSAKAMQDLSIEDVAREIRAGHPCIVSVSPFFAGGDRWKDGVVIPKGGHLAVVTGAIWTEGELSAFVVNHPSCFLELNWREHLVAADRFEASFSGNGIVFYPPAALQDKYQKAQN